MALLSGHTMLPSKTILENRQVLHDPYKFFFSLIWPRCAGLQFCQLNRTPNTTLQTDPSSQLKRQYSQPCTHGKSHRQQIFSSPSPTRHWWPAHKPTWTSTSNSISKPNLPREQTVSHLLCFEISPTKLSSTWPNFLIILWGLDISTTPGNLPRLSPF